MSLTSFLAAPTQLPKPLAANIVLCEAILTEKDEISSAIRILSIVTVPYGNNQAYFKILTLLDSLPGDFYQHTFRLQITTQSGSLVLGSPLHRFTYGYKVDPSGPGGFYMTTNVSLDLTNLGPLGNYLVTAFVDEEAVAHVALMLRRPSA